jgi:hypothetical protein
VRTMQDIAADARGLNQSSGYAWGIDADEGEVVTKIKGPSWIRITDPRNFEQRDKKLESYKKGVEDFKKNGKVGQNTPTKLERIKEMNWRVYDNKTGIITKQRVMMDCIEQINGGTFSIKQGRPIFKRYIIWDVRKFDYSIELLKRMFEDANR